MHIMVNRTLADLLFTTSGHHNMQYLLIVLFKLFLSQPPFVLKSNTYITSELSMPQTTYLRLL